MDSIRITTNLNKPVFGFLLLSALIPMGLASLQSAAAADLEGTLRVSMSHAHAAAAGESFHYSVIQARGAPVPVRFATGVSVNPLRLDGRHVKLSGTLETSVRGPRGRQLAVFHATAVAAELSSEIPRAQALAASPLAEDSGAFSTPFSLPRVAIHATLLPSGKVLFWGRDGDSGPSVTASTTYVWDPATGAVADEILNLHTYIFCSGTTLLADGAVFTAGGHVGADLNGSPHTDLYDRSANRWIAGPDMNNGRWYPTATTLGDGSVFISGGSYFNDAGTAVVDNIPQVYQPNGDLRTLTAAQTRYGYYPWTLLAPNGQVFIAGPDGTSRYVDTAGLGFVGATTYVNNAGFRGYGSAVLYNTGKILAVGGPNNASAEVIDLRAAEPAWRSVVSMRYARMYLNATILPDGQVFVSGGTSDRTNNHATAVLPTEMWNPTTEAWSTMASLSKPRVYHATSLLLPDGRVLIAGGGQPAPANGGVNNFDAEIYSPPYLFRGARPVILWAASTMDRSVTRAYGIGTGFFSSVTKVSLVRLGSATHSYDMNQRIYFPRFNRSFNQITIRLTSNVNILPPGHYLLFVLNSNGVPSVGRIVKIV